MARPKKTEKIIKHMFISDVHIPDHNQNILKLIYEFIDDFSPDYLHIVGDFVNFTDASHYLSLEDHASLEDELREARDVLHELVRRTRKKTKETYITYFEGNHESRIQRYLATNANNIRDIMLDGEPVMSLSHLLGFRKLGIEFIPYTSEKYIHGIIIEHGDMVRKHAGYTAKGMLEKRHNSGISGHTHRQAMVRQRYRNDIKFWIELGCLCNLEPIPSYVRNPNWGNGFAVGFYSPQTDRFYPHLIPIEDESFYFEGKLYKGGDL